MSDKNDMHRNFEEWFMIFYGRLPVRNGNSYEIESLGRWTAWQAATERATAIELVIAQPVQKANTQTVTESIFSGNFYIIPLADVCHVEKRPKGYLMVVLKGTTWDSEAGEYNNAPCLEPDQAKTFMIDWMRYRHELEINTLMPLEPLLLGDIAQPEQSAADLIEECRAALAEELAGWDIDPPLQHVKQAHDNCVAWLLASAERTH